MSTRRRLARKEKNNAEFACRFFAIVATKNKDKSRAFLKQLRKLEPDLKRRVFACIGAALSAACKRAQSAISEEDRMG